MPDPGAPQPFIKFLADSGIQGIFHYVPLHSATYARENGSFDDADPCRLPTIGPRRLVRLPCCFGLESGDQDRVIEAKN